MELFLESFREYTAEYMNLAIVLVLIFAVGKLGLLSLKRKYFEWASPVMYSSAAILIVLGLRVYYYIGRIISDFERNVEGVLFIANPSPLLWLALAILLFKLSDIISLYEKLEKRLKRLEGN